jgi:hypothetical protein
MLRCHRNPDHTARGREKRSTAMELIELAYRRLAMAADVRVE